MSTLAKELARVKAASRRSDGPRGFPTVPGDRGPAGAKSAAKKVGRLVTASILFAPDVAKDMDNEAFLAVGRNGLAGLMQVDSKFESFKGNLFSDHLKNVDRNSLTSGENADLDKIIESFLARLSPLVQRPSASKALEWLIHRFKINLFNVNAVIECIIPYHDTPLFVTIVSRQSGSAVSRQTIAEQCIRDAGLSLIFANCLSLQVERSSLKDGGSNGQMVSFFTSVIVTTLTLAKSVEESFVRALMPTLFCFLTDKSSSDMQAAALIITARIIDRSLRIVDNISTDAMIPAVALLSTLYASLIGKNASISPSLVMKLLNNWKLAIAQSCSIFNVNPLIELIVANVPSNLAAVELLATLCRDVPLKNEALQRYVSLLLQLGGTKDGEQSIAIQLAFKQLAHKYAEEFSASLSRHLKSTKLSEKSLTFIDSIFGGTIHEPLPAESTTVFLSVSHPDLDVRLRGYNRLRSIVERADSAEKLTSSTEFSFIRDAFQRALSDGDEDICSVVLPCPGLESIVGLPYLQHHLPLLFESATNRSFQLSVAQAIIATSAVEHQKMAEVLVGCFLVTKDSRKVFEGVLTTLPESSLFVAKWMVDQEDVLQAVQSIDASRGEAEISLELQKIQETVFQSITEHIALSSNLELNVAFLVKCIKSSYPAARIMAATISLRLLGSEISSKLKTRVALAVLSHLKSIKFNYNELKMDWRMPCRFSISANFGDKLYDIIEQNCLFMGLSSTIVFCQKTMTSVNWFGAHEMETPENLVVELFEFICCIENRTVFETVSTVLFQALGSSSLTFLSSIWTNEEVQAEVRSYALRMALPCFSVLESCRVDLQLLIPTILIPLSSTEQALRTMAVKVLKDLKHFQQRVAEKADSKKPFPIYGYDDFYGRASDQVKVLKPALTVKLLASIADFGSEIIHDHNTLKRNIAAYLREKGQSKQESYLVFLLSSAIAMHCPKRQACLVELLNTVDSPLKTKILLPLIEKHLVLHSQDESEPGVSVLKDELIQTFTSLTVEILFKLQSRKYFNLYISILTRGESSDKIRALSVVDEVWFNSISHESQLSLLQTVIHLCCTASKEVSQLANAVLQRIEITVDLFMLSLEKMKGVLIESDEPEQKRGPSHRKNAVDVAELTALLELVDSKLPSGDVSAMLPPTFDLLGCILNSPPAKVFSVEYVRQLSVALILKVVKEVKGSKLYSLMESSLRLELIVQCVRVTENPQTHHSALLVMSEVAELFPDAVLNNVISIFTFMGANILRRDDEYSFYVIQQTLNSIIPAIVKRHSEKLARPDVIREMVPVIEVFADSLFHTPKHRRQRLFTSLISAFGHEDFLSPVFPLISQILNLDSILRHIVMISTSSTESGSTPPINLRQFTAKEVKSLKNLGLEFMDSVLKSKSFLKKINLNSEESVEAHLSDLYRHALQILVDIETSSETTSKGFSKRLSLVLMSLNHVLQLPPFVEAITEVLSHDLLKVQTKALFLLHERLLVLGDLKPSTNEADQLSHVMKKVSQMVSDTKSEDVLASGLHCLNTLISCFAAIVPSEYTQLLPKLASAHILQHPSKEIVASGIICVASLCRELGPRILPFLQPFMSAVIDIMTVHFSGVEQVADSVLLSAYKALDIVIKVLPGFMSPFMPAILKYLLESATTLQGDSQAVQQIDLLRMEIATTIPKMIPTRVLLPAIVGELSYATTAGSQQILFLFDILSMALSAISAEELKHFHMDLVKFFLKSFEYRQNTHTAVPEKDVAAVETCIISCFLEFVLLLNESLFKPMFFLVLDWAQVDKRDDEPGSGIFFNQLFMYKLMDAMLGKLKSIFTPYFANLLDNATYLLELFPAGDSLDERWPSLVTSLHKFFMFSKAPLSDTRFNALTTALANQLDVVDSFGTPYKRLVVGLLTPCLGEFAVFAGKEALWKVLNRAILLKSRSESPEVRVASVRIVQEFYIRLGEDFIVLFPETVPFLAELREDNDERVQMGCQELAAEIQKHLGEDLSTFF
ncbi:hypothetical protein DFJ73DRAFT_825808 [Zopfochytrium polystomum]|nr:hypothetical protein DFJ73DRAFT_825808 [Zopfochytrium polystomum]